MSAETFQTDSNGKLITCTRSRFVPGEASRQCVRPPHPASQPCAFPTDKAHIACQQELAELRADRDEILRKKRGQEGYVEQVKRAQVEAERKYAEARDVAIVALGYLELHAALPDGGNKQGAQDIARRLRKVLGVAP